MLSIYDCVDVSTLDVQRRMVGRINKRWTAVHMEERGPV
jgi:hypothetical protein